MSSVTDLKTQMYIENENKKATNDLKQMKLESERSFTTEA